MTHKLGIATISLGFHPSHTLERKLRSASENGFDGVEIVISDLEGYAKRHSLTLLDAAKEVKELCAKEGLEIISLASIINFEGMLTPLEERLDRVQGWIDVSRVLGTSTIQIPSTYDKNSTGDEDVIVSEFKQLAALGKKGGPTISFAYEALAWGEHISLWEDSLRIVELVDSDNFGLCLDTYHVVARVWADLQSKTGRVPGGDFALRASIRRFLKDCPTEKIFYVQLCDMEKQDPPYLPSHPDYDPERDPTDVLCYESRIFPYQTELGAYFPLDDILRAWLVEKGWSGYCSMEIFHRDMKEKTGPEEWAKQGQISWQRVKQRVGLA